ncbi:MAG: type II toxin-antitoxin system RelE/ParE family toxin [Deltaproteobacteria bacterium]|nr:type II toxin-antitoxin system RelE/ParE family toxin [Deltaproteobacteria bacterium]
MERTVEYYKNAAGHESAAGSIDGLPVETRTRVLRLIKLLKDYGVLLKGPYTKQIRGKIRELRINDGHGAIIILYFTYTGKRFILLHGFIKKTDRTPLREIETAEGRMNDFIRRENIP